jgi:large-conductance mechanosensitive channel
VNALVLGFTTLASTLVVLAEEEDFDPNTVTPGVIGFIITFLVAAATVLIVIDMNRRVRRTRYRTEIREKLQAEQDDAVDTER